MTAIEAPEKQYNLQIFESSNCCAHFRLGNESVVLNKAFKEEALERIIVADEQFFDRNKEYWNNYMDSIGAAFDLTYPQGHAKLKKLDEELTKDFEKNSDATLAVSPAPPWHKILIQSIGLGTHSNAIRASVEIYISKPERANFLTHCPPACLEICLAANPFNTKEPPRASSCAARAKIAEIESMSTNSRSRSDLSPGLPDDGSSGAGPEVRQVCLRKGDMIVICRKACSLIVWRLF